MPIYLQGTRDSRFFFLHCCVSVHFFRRTFSCSLFAIFAHAFAKREKWFNTNTGKPALRKNIFYFWSAIWRSVQVTVWAIDVSKAPADWNHRWGLRLLVRLPRQHVIPNVRQRLSCMGILPTGPISHSRRVRTYPQGLCHQQKNGDYKLGKSFFGNIYLDKPWPVVPIEDFHHPKFSTWPKRQKHPLEAAHIVEAVAKAFSPADLGQP